MPSGSYTLYMLFWPFFSSNKSCSYVPKAAVFPEASLPSQGLVNFYLAKSYCLCVRKHRGALVSQNFSYFYITILLLAVVYKILVTSAHIDVTRTIHNNFYQHHVSILFAEKGTAKYWLVR